MISMIDRKIAALANTLGCASDLDDILLAVRRLKCDPIADNRIVSGLQAQVIEQSQQIDQLETELAQYRKPVTKALALAGHAVDGATALVHRLIGRH